jgi:hypothetical protein
MVLGAQLMTKTTNKSTTYYQGVTVCMRSIFSPFYGIKLLKDTIMRLIQNLTISWETNLRLSSEHFVYFLGATPDLSKTLEYIFSKMKIGCLK